MVEVLRLKRVDGSDAVELEFTLTGGQPESGYVKGTVYW